MPLDINTLNVRVNLQPTPSTSGESPPPPALAAEEAHADSAQRLAAQMRLLMPVLRDNLFDRLDR